MKTTFSIITPYNSKLNIRNKYQTNRQKQKANRIPQEKILIREKGEK